MLIDTHVHLEPGDDVAGMVGRAAAAGVESMVAVGGSPEMNTAALAAAAEFPDGVLAATGLDRALADQVAAADVPARLRDLIARSAAIGEIGLDYHYAPETAAVQRELFEAQLQLAREEGKPVIVHSREAEADTLAALRRHRDAWDHAPERIGVLHCFTGSLAFARALVALDYRISFSGILTFRNADPLRAVAAALPEEALLLETDSPYLAPVPHRGHRNEPALLPPVAAVLARVRGISEDAVAVMTTRNALALFWGD